MKTSMLRLVLFLAVSLLIACQGTVLPAWDVIAEYNVHHSVMTAGFLNENYAITGGVVGYMFHTTDGGKTWSEDINSSDCRYGMEILDEQHAWTCGGMTHVRRSEDGGLTWQEIASFGLVRDGPCRLMSFVDPQNGWLASAHHMGVTTDGGDSWRIIAEPDGSDSEHIVGIGLYAPQRGYMMKSSGAIYHTADDSAHWSSVPSPKPDGWEFPLSVYAVVTMRFQDAEHGIVVMHLKKGQEEQVVAYHTVNAGQNWTSERVPVKPGPLYISQDGRLLTVITGANMMTLLRYNGK